MPVSANTLFHFTSFGTLKKILNSGGFWPQYSLERFDKALPKKSNYISAYIPMVCFCDLKLTQLSDTTISKHTKDFGNYGIGFKKNWGVQKSISPVSYIHQKSVSSNTIDQIINEINKQPIAINKKLAPKLGEIVKFLKPYQGFYQKGSRKRNLINYYDEREWRYIPKGSRYKAFPFSKAITNSITKYNIELRSKPLTFNTSDIKYIIISRDIEKTPLADIINKLSITTSEKVDLISKIISLKEIREDF